MKSIDQTVKVLIQKQCLAYLMCQLDVTKAIEWPYAVYTIKQYLWCRTKKSIAYVGHGVSLDGCLSCYESFYLLDLMWLKLFLPFHFVNLMILA